MIRSIAVMRRRSDSYVNATQILKVAGVDKGRRTKILEKEILPGKHEIVQGGYGKYQGTWLVVSITVCNLAEERTSTRSVLKRSHDSRRLIPPDSHWTIHKTRLAQPFLVARPCREHAFA